MSTQLCRQRLRPLTASKETLNRIYSISRLINIRFLKMDLWFRCSQHYVTGPSVNDTLSQYCTETSREQRRHVFIIHRFFLSHPGLRSHDHLRQQTGSSNALNKNRPPPRQAGENKSPDHLTAELKPFFSPCYRLSSAGFNADIF